MKTKPKKPAKRKVVTRSVTGTLGYEVVIVRDGKMLAKCFCLKYARRFFDLAGMKPGDVRRFKITTEVVDDEC